MGTQLTFTFHLMKLLSVVQLGVKMNVNLCTHIFMKEVNLELLADHPLVNSIIPNESHMSL